jgi:hypothetical protein
MLLKTKELVRDALAEDDREGSHLGGIGFAQFFPEEDESTVREAWVIYDEIVYGDNVELQHDVIEDFVWKSPRMR